MLPVITGTRYRTSLLCKHSTVMMREMAPGANVFFCKKLKNISCEYDGLNGWNSTLQPAWYMRHVRIIWFLWTKRTMWLLIRSTQFYTKYRPRVFYVLPLEDIGRWLPWMLPGSTGRFSITILCTDTSITLIKGRDYIKHDINVRHVEQNPRRGRWL